MYNPFYPPNNPLWEVLVKLRSNVFQSHNSSAEEKGFMVRRFGSRACTFSQNAMSKLFEGKQEWQAGRRGDCGEKVECVEVVPDGDV